MQDDLTVLERWAEPLLARLTPAASRKLALQVARQARQLQAEGIRAQRAPDGSAWPPRKSPARTARGGIRRKAQASKAGMDMFRRLRTPAHMKARASVDEAIVAIEGRAARIARVHHEGLADQVQPGGPSVAYPARPLMGVNDALRQMVRDAVLDHLRGGLGGR